MKIWSILAETHDDEDDDELPKGVSKRNERPTKLQVLVAADDQFAALELSRSRVAIGDDWTVRIELFSDAAPVLKAGVIGQRKGIGPAFLRRFRGL